MKRIVSLLLALVMCFALVACGETEQKPADETTPEQAETKEWPRMTIGGADSTGTMYAAAAAIATTITNAVDGMTIDATTSSGSNENALNVHNGDVELGMCTGDAALNAYNGVGKFADVGECKDLRYIGCVYASTMNWVALKDSGYTYLHDLAGKGAAVGTGPSASSTETVALLTLEAAGVTDYAATACTLGDAAEA